MQHSTTENIENGSPAPVIERSNQRTQPEIERVLFLQPFGISDVGGGSRILRTLIQTAPVECVSIVTSRAAPSPTNIITEKHFPGTPTFGRLGRTRLSKWLLQSSFFWKPICRIQLERQLHSLSPAVMHLVIQPGLDARHLIEVARKLKAKLAVSFHDHYRYFLQTGAYHKQNMDDVRIAWQSADHRFVISGELGDSLANEFGRQEFTIITDGVENTPQTASSGPDGDPVVYFMGQFHSMYEANFAALIHSLGMVAESNGHPIKLLLRGRWIPELPFHPLVQIERLPLGNDRDVADDLSRCNIAYLPLPFEEKFQDFSAYSLSTKMITYLAAGRPVLYHGPADAAAGRLLQREQAAMCHASLEATSLADVVADLTTNRERAETIANNGLRLVRERFRCQRISEHFWSKILSS